MSDTPRDPKENLDCQIEGSILTIRVDLRCPGVPSGANRGVAGKNITVATSAGFRELTSGVKGSVTICVPKGVIGNKELREIREGIEVAL